jgi:hypothetical protein
LYNIIVKYRRGKETFFPGSTVRCPISSKEGVVMTDRKHAVFILSIDETEKMNIVASIPR